MLLCLFSQAVTSLKMVGIKCFVQPKPDCDWVLLQPSNRVEEM